ncbi:MAG: hypothetical protein J0L87_02345 [Bacteroidetes bacterium]|nr:hypothetical protein [Bacteroidota bacterium]
MLKQLLSSRIYILIFILLISVLGIIRLQKEPELYPTGDAIEYTIMTEAFFNHFTPDVRSSDFDTFKEAFCKKRKWDENDKYFVYDAAQKFIASSEYKLLDFNYAFFVDKTGKKYSCHFFAYSLINLPSRVLCSLVGFDPLFTHQLTNLILILLTTFLFFKFSPFDRFYTSTFALMFFFSTNYWYISWQHPEVFTVCFSSLGFWLFLAEKRYWGIFLISIAALQNQPIAVLVVGLSAFTFFKETISIKNTIKLGFSSFLIFIPSLFYFYHFGETNLIKYQGALSFDYVSFTRVWGLFFDINQGAILAIPFVLFAYIVLIVRKIFIDRSKRGMLEIIIISCTIISVCIAGTIDNWNHGQSVVNRYVTYFSGIILVHFTFLLYELKNSKLKNGVVLFATFTQMITVLYHNSLSPFDWSTNLPKPISNWVLDNIPSLYNPDPVIFVSRYNPKAGNDVVYYMKENGEITKFLVNEKNTVNLKLFGFSDHQIDSIVPHLNFINKWAYIDVDDKIKGILSPVKLKQLDNARKIKEQIEVIKSTPEWYEQILLQSKNENISIDDALEKNAKFVLKIYEEIPQGGTKEEKINAKIMEIKANASWLDLLKVKASEQKISLDSAIYLDAKWMVDEEAK